MDTTPVKPTEEPTTVPETTVEPTTEATEPTVTAPVTEPTTEATEPTVTAPVTEPTTEATEPTVTVPVTTAPVTEPITTEPVTEPTTVPVPAAKYTVAGDAGLTGATWDPAQNEMTKGEYEFAGNTYDYAITFENVAAGSYAFKVTDGTWENSWGKDNANYSITLSAACPVTIYFNSETKAIDVEAEFLSTFTLDSVTVAGNGEDAWLNGADWDPTDSSNDMTEIEPGVWQIKYYGIDAFDNYQFKIACNHGWTYNWTSDGIFDGQENPSNEVLYDNSTVTITIDLNGFDFTTKTGVVIIDFAVEAVAPLPIIGDVNLDGEVTIQDATLLQKYLAGLATLSEEQLALADVNGDEYISISDITAIQKLSISAKLNF